MMTSANRFQRVVARGGTLLRQEARDAFWRRMVARAGDAENSGGACRRLEGPVKTKFHRKADRGDYFPMMLSMV